MSQNVRKKPGLSAKQLRAIEALLREPTITAAAKTVGVNERQIFRWLNTDEFARAYQNAKKRMFDSGIAKLQAGCELAASVLLAMVVNKETPASVRVTACARVLDLSLRAREMFEIEERLAAIEAKLETRHPPGLRSL